MKTEFQNNTPAGNEKVPYSVIEAEAEKPDKRGKEIFDIIESKRVNYKADIK